MSENRATNNVLESFLEVLDLWRDLVNEWEGAYTPRVLAIHTPRPADDPKFDAGWEEMRGEAAERARRILALIDSLGVHAVREIHALKGDSKLVYDWCNSQWSWEGDELAKSSWCKVRAEVGYALTIASAASCDPLIAESDPSTQGNSEAIPEAYPSLWELRDALLLFWYHDTPEGNSLQRLLLGSLEVRDRERLNRAASAANWMRLQPVIRLRYHIRKRFGDWSPDILVHVQEWLVAEHRRDPCEAQRTRVDELLSLFGDAPAITPNGSGQADSEADNQEKSKKIIPDNLRVVQLASLIEKAERDHPLRRGEKTEIARNYVVEQSKSSQDIEDIEREVESLLRQVRRYRHLLSKSGQSGQPI